MSLSVTSIFATLPDIVISPWNPELLNWSSCRLVHKTTQGLDRISLLMLYKMVNCWSWCFPQPFPCTPCDGCHSRVTAARWEWSSIPCPLPKAVLCSCSVLQAFWGRRGSYCNLGMEKKWQETKNNWEEGGMRRVLWVIEQTQQCIQHLHSFNPVPKEPWLSQTLALVRVGERGRGQR